MSDTKELTKPSWSELEQMTAEHMDDPQVGDLFHEMYSYWVRVAVREGSSLVTLEGVGGSGKQERIEHKSIADFKARFAYGSIPGYSIQLYRK